MKSMDIIINSMVTICDNQEWYNKITKYVIVEIIYIIKISFLSKSSIQKNQFQNFDFLGALLSGHSNVSK